LPPAWLLLLDLFCLAFFLVDEPSERFLFLVSLGPLARLTRLLCEFQWFLMALSVRPGMCRAISAHLLPKLSCNFFNNTWQDTDGQRARENNNTVATK
jgi:hypothetical protein